MERKYKPTVVRATGYGSVTVVPVSRLLTNYKIDKSSALVVNDVASEGAAGGTDLLSMTAASWCFSFALHIIGYTVAPFIFGWLGLKLIPDQPRLQIPPIRASLENETQIDDLPRLEIIPAAGPATEEATQSLQQLANHLAVSDRGQWDTVLTDARLATTGSEDSDAGDQGESPFFQIPETGLAVTKGSFTAWTDPPQPDPGQFYQIIIEMRLPDKVKHYRISDLSGVVTGSDGYRQVLPFDRNSPGAARVTGGSEYKTVRRNMTVNVTGTKLQLAIRVPGAERLVKDRIRIKSRRLREEQEMVLVFGGGQKSKGIRGDEE